jgi:hypothetical protein
MTISIIVHELIGRRHSTFSIVLKLSHSRITLLDGTFSTSFSQFLYFFLFVDDSKTTNQNNNQYSSFKVIVVVVV